VARRGPSAVCLGAQSVSKPPQPVAQSLQGRAVSQRSGEAQQAPASRLWPESVLLEAGSWKLEASRSASLWGPSLSLLATCLLGIEQQRVGPKKASQKVRENGPAGEQIGERSPNVRRQFVAAAFCPTFSSKLGLQWPSFTICHQAKPVGHLHALLSSHCVLLVAINAAELGRSDTMKQSRSSGCRLAKACQWPNRNGTD